MRYVFPYLFVLPTVALAQVNDAFDVTFLIYDWIERLSFLFMAGALALFVWGLVKFIYNAADTKAHEEGKQLIVWGVIAFFVLVSLWGLVRFLSDSLSLGNVSDPVYRDKNGNPI